VTAGRGRGMLSKAGIGAAIGIAAALVAWLALRTAFFGAVEMTTYDLRMRATARPSAPSDRVVLVNIDDDSVRRMEPLVGRWPWPRLAHASLINYLARGQAKLVVYDVLFTEADKQRFTLGGETAADGTIAGGEEWTGAESDQAFADAIKSAGNVILAGDARAEALIDASKTLTVPLDHIPSLNQSFGGDACVEPRPQLIPPIPAIATAARAIGHSFMVLDPDGPIRRMIPFVRVGERFVPSLSVSAVIAAQALTRDAVEWRDGDTLTIGTTTVPLVESVIPAEAGGTVRACRSLIPFRGPVIRDGVPTFTQYSFYDLFEAQYYFDSGAAPPADRTGQLIDPAVFKNKIVVVGASASGTFDVFPVPFPGSTPGSHIHANAIEALLTGTTMGPASATAGVAGTVVAALAIGVAGAFVAPWILAAMASGTGLLIVWLSLRWFAGGLWTPLVQPLLAVALAFVGQLAWHYFVEGREKRQVKKLFSRYVPKDVYDQLMADPERAALGGRRRTMTVLFSDVRGFTAMSEKATPEEVVGQLNEYFSRMVQVLFEHRGTLDKFVGDMVMGLFGAPLDDPDHAEHAVQTAIAMSKALDELNRGWAAAGRPVLDIGIGISTGEMVAGNIGSEAIMSYTVIGDRVNLGARLESLNKEYGTRIIISETTREALKGRYDIHPLGEVVVKGKSRPVAIYEVKAS
jgi:adenylate cyclase